MKMIIKLKKERFIPHQQTLVALLFFLVCYFFNACMQVVVQYSDGGFSGTLPDVGQENLNFIDNNSTYINNILSSTLIGSGVITIIFRGDDMGLTRRVFFIYGSMFILRGFSIWVTRLPNGSESCESNVTGNLLSDSILNIFGSVRTCQDVLFSGHTATITLFSLVLHYYLPHHYFGKGSIAVKLLLWGFAFFGMSVIISTRFHFTIDVYFGFWVTWFIWHLYHVSLWHQTLVVKHSRAKEVHIFVQVFRWFEGLDQNKELETEQFDPDTYGTIIQN